MPEKQPKVLIVEDDPNNHPLYRTIFEERGFEVVIFKNADGEFIEWVESLQPDIISMDIMIGDESGTVERDGFEAIALLQSNPRTKHIPIIVLSNFTSEERVRKSKELGATDYIVPQSMQMQRIPDHYLRYLNDPAGYKPWHTIFREG